MPSADADLVVEAVFEKLDVKHELFRDARQDLPRRARCSRRNTSAHPDHPDRGGHPRPEAVVGTHFFSPVPMMGLCELVRGYKTSDETLAAARAFAE